MHSTNNHSSVLSIAVVRKTFIPLLSFISIFMLVSCGKMPTAVNPEKTGQIEVRACVLTGGMAKETTSLQTTFDSLIVEVTGIDFGKIRNAFRIDPLKPFIEDTITNIPAGSNRTVKIYTVNRSNQVIHVDSTGEKTIRIDAGVTNVIRSILVPAYGSVYIQINNIPTKVDSIFGAFMSVSSQTWLSKARRSTRVNMSIDNIPNGTKGDLLVVAVDSTGDTLYRARNTVTINALNMTSVPLSFTSTPGGLALQMSITLPAATVASGSIESPDVSTVENGTLLVTEIMYAANDSEYVELYNPGTRDTTFDTLILDIDGVNRIFTNVTIGAGAYFVIGRKALPWADTYHPTASALDLSSSGNWITVRSKSGTIMDRVSFAGGSNSIEWPSVSGKRSITLDTLSYSTDGNNYGRNWHEATVAIPGCTSQFGTPHSR